MAQELIQDLERWLVDLGVTGKKTSDHNFMTLCPFHAEDTPSCAIDLEKQFFKCHGCGANGNVVSFLAQKLGQKPHEIRVMLGMAKSPDKKIDGKLSEKTIAAWHEQLKKSPMWQARLREKGVTLETAQTFQVGFDGERLTIPIRGTTGALVNVRRYLPNAKTYKTVSLSGHGSAVIYPITELQHDELILTEGELKALLCIQNGFHAITATCGASSFNRELAKKLDGKRVAIAYDVDTAGVKNAIRVAKMLLPFAASVKIIKLPLENFPKGDITNYFVDLRHSAHDLRALIESTELYTHDLDAEERESYVGNVHLSQATNACYTGKTLSTDVIVSAKDTVAYVIPKTVKCKCDRDCEECPFCHVFHRELDEEFTLKVEQTSPQLLELCNIPKAKLIRALYSVAGIPSQCKSVRFKIEEQQNVEEIRVIPQLKTEDTGLQNIAIRAFYCGFDIQTNTNYKLTCKPVPDPETQHATLLISKAEQSQDILYNFTLDDESADALQIFQPQHWTLDSLEEKLDEIYTDFECNITRIYQRRHLHIFYDLVYHSALYINFQEKPIKGWVEGLVIGDSGQGKSETIRNLLEHYKLGEKIDSKGATVAGLLGGLQETAKRWFVTWGSIPLNDKRLIVLEEVKGMPSETIAKLTDMRSSGIAEIAKIQHAKTFARTRLIWITNPKSDFPIAQHNYGVSAIPPIFGSLEDVRRLDFAMVVASGEVDNKWLNVHSKERPRCEHVFTSDLCRKLILFAWSRQAEEIIIEDEAESLILRYAGEMGAKYSAQIPLVESADQRLKLVRLATACAMRSFSVDEKLNVIVRPCHVEFVKKFLEDIYDDRFCGYRDFSAAHALQHTTQFDLEVVTRAFSRMPNGADLAQFMIGSLSTTPQDVCDWTGCTKDQAAEFIGALVRGRAIYRGRKYYVKTQAFIEFLKREAGNLVAVASQETAEDF